MDLKRILFLCTGNSCRSQMAEGFARVIVPEGGTVYSAGISPAGVHPLAIKVMAEIEIDISGQSSKGISAIPMNQIDAVITLCDHANRVCPSFPGSVERFHFPIDDPIRVRGSDDEVLQAFRTARDKIQSRLSGFFQNTERSE